MVVATALGCPADGDGDSASGADGSGGTDGTMPNTCEELAGQEGEAVTLRVSNVGALPVFLVGAGCGSAVSMYGPDQSEQLTQWRFPSCDLPECGDANGCGVDCADCIGGFIRVDAGAVYDVPWTGTVWVDADVPASCGAQWCGPSCHREIVAPPGSYSLRVGVADACPLADADACNCPDGEETCFVPDYEGGTTESVEADVSFTPEEGTVLLEVGA